MELKNYLSLIKRWAWLLIVGFVLGGLGAFLWSSYQTPIYQATTKMLVMRPPQERTADLSYLSDQQLSQTFIQLLKTSPVLDGTAKILDVSVNSSQIEAAQVRDTQVLSLTVQNADPVLAAEIANTMVKVLIDQNEKLQAGRYATAEESLTAQTAQIEQQVNNLQSQIDQITTQSVQDQTAKVEAKIASMQSEIAQLESDIQALSASKLSLGTPELDEKTARLATLKSTLALYEEIYSNLVVLGKPSEANAPDRLTRLQKTLDLYQQIYLQLLNNLEEVRLARLQNTPNVVQIEAATTPTRPISPRTLTNTALGAAVGLLLAAGIAFAFEYLNDTLNTPSEVDQILGLPILGYVAEMHHKQNEGEVYVASFPRSPVAEAFRSLRTNLEFTGGEHPLKTILVTSSRPGEGKSTIASNLAAIFAQSGKRVILVDADMRRPAIHRMAGIKNRTGLSTLLRDTLKVETVWHKWGNAQNMHIITSGSLPPDPTELLGSDRMLLVLSELRQSADIIIFDSPPSVVADSQVLASLVDGVVLVLRPGKSPIDEAQATLTQLKRANGKILGVVFNRIPGNRSHYYGGYRYYSANSYNAYTESPNSNKTPPVQAAPKYEVEKMMTRAPERSNGHSKKEVTTSQN